MKKLMIFAIGCLLSSGCFAQQLSITNPIIREKDNLVTVSFRACIQPIKKNDRIMLSPVLYSGANTLTLSPMVVSGRKKMLSDLRKGLKHGERVSKRGGTLLYTTTVVSAQWMDSLSLRVACQTENCCVVRQLPELNVVDQVEVRFHMQPRYSNDTIVIPLTELQKFDQQANFLYPIADYQSAIKNFDALREEGALLVYFKQGYSTIDLSYRENAKSLDQIRHLFDLIEADTAATLKKIVLAGASSPEGKAKYNLALAGKRVDALKGFSSKKNGDMQGLFEVVNLGEDWTKLRRFVEKESTMPGREKTLAIIDNFSVEGGREKKLMDLEGGRPYQYMFKYFFPELRNAGYIQIYYELKPNTALLELNNAIRLVNEKQYTAAAEVLRPLKHEQLTDNLMGVCLMMQHQYAEAEIYLKRAAAAGNSDAMNNLEQLRKVQQFNE